MQNARESREALIDSIRETVRRIPREVGMYASLSEGNEPGGEVLLSVYLDEPSGRPRILQASTRPQDDELTFTGLLDELMEWISKRRKAA